MTGLHQSALTTSQKVECAAKVLAGQEVHGTISALSREFDLSRPTVYELRNTTEEVLREHFEKEDTEYRTVHVEVDRAQLERAVVALRAVGPNAIRPIEDLLPIVYPGVRVSYGTIQSIVVQAGQRAKAFNEQAELGSIQAGALDEMFSQGDPVLAGVDLDSGYLFALQRREGRSGQDWAEVLNQAKAQGLALDVVVKDAAKGIAAGVKAVFPEAEQRDDCFHVLYELNKVRRQLEQRAYAAIAAEQEAQQGLGKIRAQHHKRRRGQRQKIARARRQCQQAITRFDAFEAAAAHVHEALEYVDLQTGQWRCGDDVRQLIAQAAQAIAAIQAPGCAKLAGYLVNRAEGLALATTALSGQLSELAEAYSACAVSLACMIWRALSQYHRRSSYEQRNENLRLLTGAYAQLQALLDSQTDTLLKTVKGWLDKRHRASSAIEGFNAALRPYLYVHKGVTQNFLELFRAHYNLRTRRWGRHKGTSAHECLTGVPVDDWLSLLGYPPSGTIH